MCVWADPVPVQGVGIESPLASSRPCPSPQVTPPQPRVAGEVLDKSWVRPHRAVPARSRTAARENSAEVSSGGLAGSSFVGSLVNLFPGWRVKKGRGRGVRAKALQPPPAWGLCEALGAPLGMVWRLPLLFYGLQVQPSPLGEGINAPGPGEGRDL